MKQWKKDDVGVFAGYSDPNIADDEKILEPGTRVTIFSVDGDSLAAVPVGRNEDGSMKEGGTIYPDEIMTVEEWQAKTDAEKGVTEPETMDEANTDDAEAAAAPDKPKKAMTGKKAAKAKADAAAADDKEAAAAPTAKKSKAKKEAAAEGEQTELEVETEGEAQIEVHHSSSVAALLAEKDALEAAKELVNRAEETDFTLGGVLSVIQRDGIHQRLGYDGKRGFEDYIEKELGVRYRKARYLINIYEYFTKLNIDEARLAEIGWSKAKELVGIATAENFDDIVDYGKDHTRDELVEHLRSTYVNAGDGSESQATAKKTTWTFKLFDDQNTIVNNAIEAAKVQAGSDDPSAALEHICAEWSLMNENQQTTVEEAIALVEARFGIKLAQVHETDDGQTDLEDAVNGVAAEGQQAAE